MTQAFDHLIIGAGISGLGMAHHSLRRGLSTLVLEADPRVGGCINSRCFPDCDGFWVEGGSHTCFNSYGHLLDLLDDLGLGDRLVAKARLRYALWREGARRSLLAAIHPLELLGSLPRLVTGRKAGRRVAEFYGAGLGRGNYRDLFGPAFCAVLCQEADDFPAELLFRRKPRRKEVVRSFTFPDGLSEIPRALASEPGLEVHTGQVVTALAAEGSGFRARTAAGEEWTSAYLTLAVPPDRAAALLAGLSETLASEVGAIGVREVESLACVVAREAIPSLPPLAGLIAVDEAFYSMVSRDYLTDSRYRGFSFHFRPGALPPEAQAERAAAALGLRPEALAATQRIGNRLPALRVDQGERVARLDAALAGQRLALVGNWFYGVSIEDCLTRVQREQQRLFG